MVLKSLCDAAGLLEKLLNVWYLIWKCFVSSAGEVQRSRKERSEQLSVLSAARNSGDTTRQRERRAAQWGTEHGERPNVWTLWTLWTLRGSWTFWSFSQIKYKESGKKERSSSIYSTLPDTSETNFAREMSDMQSEVWSDTPTTSSPAEHVTISY